MRDPLSTTRADSPERSNYIHCVFLILSLIPSYFPLDCYIRHPWRKDWRNSPEAGGPTQLLLISCVSGYSLLSWLLWRNLHGDSTSTIGYHLCLSILKMENPYSQLCGRFDCLCPWFSLLGLPWLNARSPHLIHTKHLCILGSR